jgi:hypothetical protein
MSDRQDLADGLVTNPAATAYVLTHTGSMNVDAWSAGGYWTHTGPGDDKRNGVRGAFGARYTW